MNEEGVNIGTSEILSIELAAQRDLVRKTNFIIALQGKLLAQTEEIDALKRENLEEKRKNENMTNKVRIILSRVVSFLLWPNSLTIIHTPYVKSV